MSVQPSRGTLPNPEEPPIYLDYNATTPHAPETVAAMMPYLQGRFGNPSSSHPYGVQAREAVENARDQVAGLLGCRPGEIFFTGGGTEANNLAIRGAVRARRSRGSHIVSSEVEHPAVTRVCERLRSEGFEVDYVPVDRWGIVDAAELERRIREDTVLISIMHANNEVGTIQPIKEIGRLARSRGILFHTDAAQSVAKVPVDVDDLGVDLLSVAGHKLYAPKGVGALYVRDGVELDRLMEGAGQERGLRPGTENVLEIVGLGAACALARNNLSVYAETMRRTRDRLEEELRSRVDGIRFNGHSEHRLPNTSSVGFRGVDADRILAALEQVVAASAGAACHAGEVSVSHVLRAMRVPEEFAAGTLRLSTGRETTESDATVAAAAVADAVKGLRGGRTPEAAKES
jgi:cysteine desulfurase